MSGVCPRGGEEQQQTVVGGVGGEVPGGRGACLSFYHVPQQCRREKLRYPNADEPPRWPPHALPSPPSLFHCDTPLSTAVAPATASFMPPSSSLVPNPGYNATPYAHGFTPIHLLDHHYGLLGGTKGHQVQGVSLSLSSAAPPSHHSDQHHHGPAVCATAFTGHLPLPPTVPRIGLVPTGPFTGYAAILQGSRFLRPAQQLLEAACGGGSTMVGAMVCCGGEVEQLDLVADGLGDCSENVDSRLIGNGASRKMKSRLISMLDEVCKRYKQYYEQIQAVITSFEVVAGLNTAAPYIYVAFRSLSKHFKCLKSTISDQLQFETIALGKDGQSEDEMPGHRGMNGSLCYQQRVMHSPGAINPQPVWRPQRGLPERAVAVLRAWLFEHFLHPYPTDMDKQMLAKQTGLSRNQVSNWFINARVRLWKPMVEEIHSLELQHVHIPEGGSHCDASKHPVFSSTSAVSPNNKQTPPNVIGEKIPEQRHKRLRDELPQLPNHIKEPLKFSLDDPSTNHSGSVPMGFASAAANGGISLTLGLHQTDGVCFSEPLPLNIVRRFGLEESSVAYAMGGFDGQDRHFGRDIDGQWLRHFVAR